MLILKMRAHGRSAGMSLVELLVGLAIGLFIVAGATMVVGTQLGDNRRLLLETQLQQDLRAAADIITRDLRRAGHWTDAYKAAWSPTLGPATENPFLQVTVSGTPTTLEYRYRRAGNQEGPFGFRLSSGVLQIQVSPGNWQDLTDSRTMTVTQFAVTPTVVDSARLACPKACSDGTDACWPTVTTREYAIAIAAQAKSDASVQRTLQTAVRLRNDQMDFASSLGGAPCPN